ncbi:MAG: aminopeptidase [Olegusella sp.]|nr:aminopeptidase [Olegusella sp.]
MERPNAWKTYDADRLAELERITGDYREFISDNKTEREVCASAVKLAQAAGYADLADCVRGERPLHPGDKVYAVNRGKSLLLAVIGREGLEAGVNILGAHIDSPRLDVKQNPLDEKDGLAYLDTHYYGGIKKYQWVTLPLAIHGVVAKKDGSVVDVRVGEDPADPVFVITDILPHLGREQAEKKAGDFIDGEMLDLLVGSRPLVVEEGDDAADRPVASYFLNIVADKLGCDEEDFLSAELEIVPAGRARDMGADRSMILGYGQDDRVCAYTSLLAQLACEAPERTAVTLLVDKEEIGSVGATGMTSRFFENTMAEILELAGVEGNLALRRCLANSRMLSSDVSAAFDPSFPSVFEKKNAALLGNGLAFNKFTGARGKSGSNDADAEYVAYIRRVMDEGDVRFQTCELGKVDAGGGGTIAYILAEYGMQVIDCGVPVLSMHAPWEAVSKADVYEAYCGYQAFLAQA